MSDAAHEQQITARDLRDGRPAASRVRSPAALLGEPPQWDWDAGLSEGERAELARLRDTTERQRGQLESKQREIAAARSDSRAVRDALRTLAAARLWRRRRVIALLRARGLLD